MKICNISYITWLGEARIGVENVADAANLLEGDEMMQVSAIQSELFQVIQVLLLMSVSVAALSGLLWWLLPDRRRQCNLM
jgi:hypothetical protein